MPRHVPCHDALLDRPSRPGKVAHIGNEVERLAKVLSSPRLFQGDKFSVITDVVVRCLVPDQLCA